MKILITGGAGFIGSHLADALIKKRYRVVIIDNLSTGQRENINPRAKFYQIDIRSPKIEAVFRKEKPRVVYHCAAQINLRKSIENPIYDTDVNILGSLNILQSFIRVNPRRNLRKSVFIFSSTGGAIYGETPYQNKFGTGQAQNIPTPETFPPKPTSPYGLAKLTVEKFLEIYRQIYGLNYVALRYANVYGPRQNAKAEAGVIAIFITQLLKRKRPKINGDGEQTRDYVFVDDVVRANLLFLENKNYLPIRANKEIVKSEKLPIFNVGTGVETSVNEIFNGICQIMGKKVKPKYSPAIPGELMRSALDYSKIKKLGWQPTVSLDEGLSKTIQYFQSKV